MTAPLSQIAEQIDAWADLDARYNIWLDQHAAAASMEGWDVFSCTGGSYGDWQVQHFDGDGPPGFAQLNDDVEAWRIVLQGREAHHVAARAFIRKANPIEFRMWAELAGRLAVAGTPLDLSGLSDDERLALLTEVLS